MRFLVIRNIFSLANKVTFLLSWIKCIPLFILAQCEYSINIPIYLTLFQTLLQTGEVHSCLSTLRSFFDIGFCFVFLCSGCFNLKFIFYLLRFNLIFVSFCISFVSFLGPVAVLFCKVEVDFKIFPHVDS